MPLRVVRPTARIPTMIMNTSKRLNKRNLGEQKEWTQGTTESGVSRVLFLPVHSWVAGSLVETERNANWRPSPTNRERKQWLQKNRAHGFLTTAKWSMLTGPFQRRLKWLDLDALRKIGIRQHGTRYNRAGYSWKRKKTITCACPVMHTANRLRTRPTAFPRMTSVT